LATWDDERKGETLNLGEKDLGRHKSGRGDHKGTDVDLGKMAQRDKQGRKNQY